MAIKKALFCATLCWKTVLCVRRAFLHLNWQPRLERASSKTLLTGYQMKHVTLVLLARPPSLSSAGNTTAEAVERSSALAAHPTQLLCPDMAKSSLSECAHTAICFMSPPSTAIRLASEPNIITVHWLQQQENMQRSRAVLKANASLL